MKMKMDKAVLLMIACAAAVALAVGDDEEGGSYSSSVDVFHRNSPVSPHYDPSLNASEILMRDIQWSSARKKRRFRTTTTTGETRESILYPVAGGSLMRIYVPRFDRTISQTYQVLGCGNYLCDTNNGFTSFCRQLGNPQCSYADGTRTVGELALERIGLTINETKPGVLFGCGSSKVSLVSQLLNGKIIFSYCLPTIESNAPGQLKFLSENDTIANQPGVITIRMHHDVHYFILLYGISLKDDPEMVVVGSANAVMLLDSGTALTYLPTNLYAKVEQQVVKFMHQAGREPMDFPPRSFVLCYYSETSTFEGLPDFSFHLLSNQTIRFTVNQMWVLQEEYNAMCLMVVPHNNNDDRCILGNRAMINLMMEYNPMRGLLSLNHTDCGAEAAI